MSIDRTPATAEQAKAVASPTRLRILRLCHDGEWTNQQLATRLGCDPSTLLYHVRILCKAGFLEQTEQRHGPSGALEKPYRSTGLSWTLDLGGGALGAPLAMLDAFRTEYLEAGPDSVQGSSRFVLHLDDRELEKLLEKLQSVLDAYTATDDARRAEGQPPVGGLLMLHRLRQSG